MIIPQRPLFLAFDWQGFSEKNYEKAITEGPLYEDTIYGIISVKHGENTYLVDIHYEKYEGEGKRFDLEVYKMNPDQSHGEWIGSIKEIRRATDYAHFKRRAMKILSEFIPGYEIRNIYANKETP